MENNTDFLKKYQPLQAKKIEAQEVQIGDLITETHGGNTKIWRAFYKSKEYIAKGILKESIATQEELEHIFNERDTMQEMGHPGINKIAATFKDDKYLYLLLEFCEGLPVHKLLQMHSKLTSKFSKIVIYQLLNQLLEMEKKGYIYRDIKASNLILQKNGKLNLVDFGFAKKIGKERTKSFCGTLHAMAPEFFDSKYMNEQDNQEQNGIGYGYGVDHYAVGIFLFEILVGQPPFGYNPEKELITKGIQANILEEQIEDKDARDLIQKLLHINEEQRLGYKGGVQEILDHAFFKDGQQGFNKQLIDDIVWGKKTKITSDDQFQMDLQFYEEDLDAFGVYKTDSLENSAEQDADDDGLDADQKEQLKTLSSMFDKIM